MATYQPNFTRVEASSSVQGRVKSARELARQGKIEEATALVEEAVAMDPNSRIAHMVLGSLKARQMLADEAIREFREVLRIDPLNLQAYLRLSRIFLKKKELNRCEECLENAVRIDPKSAMVHFALGRLAVSKKEGERAKTHLTKALTFNPRMVNARLQLSAVYRAEGNMPEALGHLNAAVRVEPDSYRAHESLGWLHLMRKDYGGAREAFEKALTLRPENEFEARLGLAEALIEEGEIDRAEVVLRKGASGKEGRPGLHKLWGDLYLRRGLYAEAVEEYRAAQMIVADGDETAAGAVDLTSSPAGDDLAAWKKLAADLKVSTDAFRDKSRLRLGLGDDDEGGDE
jgi:Tfp pilus assembly protein PilF